MQEFMKIQSEIGRAGLIFVGSAIAIHLGNMWAILSLMFTQGGMSFILGMHTITCGAYGVALAWTRWQKAEWYMFASVVIVGIVYFFSMPYVRFAYASSQLMYSLMVIVVANWVAKKYFK
jgi:hypothetical protein